MKEELSAKDLEQLSEHGVSQDKIEAQLDNFEKGFGFADIAGAANVGCGIATLSDADIDKCIEIFTERRRDQTMIKFVPASGAASRMFKELVNYSKSCAEAGKCLQPSENVMKCIENIRKFAFYPTMQRKVHRDEKKVGSLVYEENYVDVVNYLLKDKGINYQKLPKAMLLFHSYEDGPRSAFAEHLVEGAMYARDNDGNVRLHFTISPEHRTLFDAEVKRILPEYQQKYGVRYHISFSVQKSSTDMIAIDKSTGKIARNADGSIIFRPGGHGALIENLNELESDIIFMKNIDNVTVDRMKPLTCRYKEALAGYMLYLQEQCFRFLRELDSLSITSTDLGEIEGFASKQLNIGIPITYFSMSLRQKIAFWYDRLNRPIRVCGMVRNEGEPGGGPYWVNDPITHGKSLQILESSQIDMSNRFHVETMRKSTHFNPVDIVCGVKNYRGNKFNLKNFIDRNAGFISDKSQNGIDMRIQELPGLWNGSMANWITAFVEVPVETFTPVKTLADLLRPEHIEMI